MTDYTTIDDLIHALNERIGEINTLIAALRTTPRTTEQVILLKYIETRSTPKTARFMRDQGVKNAAGKALLPPDVSQLIKDGHDTFDPVLLDFARDIFRGNKKRVARMRPDDYLFPSRMAVERNHQRLRVDVDAECLAELVQAFLSSAS